MGTAKPVDPQNKATILGASRARGQSSQPGSGKSKNSWELTKSGCHVQCPELSKKSYFCNFQTS